MATSATKENILKKIRQALSNPVPLPFPKSEGAVAVFAGATDDLAVTFAQQFIKLQGNFSFCANEEELNLALHQLISEKNWEKIFAAEPVSRAITGIAPSHADLANCDVSITGCECLVARTGSIVLSAAQSFGRTASVYAPVHVCIARTSQLFYDIKDALGFLQSKYKGDLPSFISFASGPSRTADIEKTLVTGVHGPKEVYCFLVEG